MHWFFITLLSPFLWGITNHIDKHLVSRYAKQVKYTSYIISSGFFLAFAAILIFIFKPAVIHLGFGYILLMILAGCLGAIYLFPYYAAINLEEASVVVPMFQMVPILGFIFGYFLFKEQLSLVQIIAGIIIIFGSIGLSFELDKKVRLKWQVFLLMLLSSLIISVQVVIYKFVAQHTDYWSTIFWLELGIVFFALCLLGVRDYRNNFLNAVVRQNKKIFLIIGINEVLSTTAAFIFYYAYLFLPIAVVQLVGSVQPLFVLVIGIIASIFIPTVIYENLNRKFLAQKIIFIALILIGSYLLFNNL